MGMFPVTIASRDFVMCNHIEQRPDGTIIMLVFTDDAYQNLVPETKKNIRGECHVGGWTLEPLPEDKNKTRLTLMIELDLKGNLPAYVLKKANCD